MFVQAEKRGGINKERFQRSRAAPDPVHALRCCTARRARQTGKAITDIEVEIILVEEQ